MRSRSKTTKIRSIATTHPSPSTSGPCSSLVPDTGTTSGHRLVGDAELEGEFPADSTPHVFNDAGRGRERSEATRTAGAQREPSRAQAPGRCLWRTWRNEGTPTSPRACPTPVRIPDTSLSPPLRPCQPQTSPLAGKTGAQRESRSWPGACSPGAPWARHSTAATPPAISSTDSLRRASVRCRRPWSAGTGPCLGSSPRSFAGTRPVETHVAASVGWSATPATTIAWCRSHARGAGSVHRVAVGGWRPERHAG